MSKKLITIAIVILITALILSLVVTSTKHTNTIKFGVVTPLTGDGAIYGENVINAKTMAIEEINENGGILGQKIELIYEDGACDGSKALLASQKLININNIKIIFGGVCSGETLAMAQFTEDNNVILFSSGSSSPDISKIGKYLFRNYPSEDILGVATAELIYNDAHKKIGVLVENTDYATSILDVFAKRYSELGGSIIIIEKYNSDSKDYRTQLTKIKQENIDSILFLPQTGKTGGIAVKQAHEIGINVPNYGNAQMNGNEALKNGGQSINGLKFIDAPMLSGSRSMQFIDKYNARFDKPSMDYFVGAEYDAVYIIKDAIEYCKTINTDCIKDYLYNMGSYNGVIGDYNFNKDGDVQNIKFVIKQIIDAEKEEITIID